MNNLKVAEILEELTMLKFFPAGDYARMGILKLVCDMCETEDQVRWLVKRTIALHNEWPGPKELRAVFCSRHKPKDGINAYSEIFIDGVPPEKLPALSSGEQLALPPGHVATADVDLDRKIQRAANAMKMKPASPERTRFAQELAAVLTAPQDRPETSGPTMSESRRAELQLQVDEELRKAGRS